MLVLFFFFFFSFLGVISALCRGASEDKREEKKQAAFTHRALKNALLVFASNVLREFVNESG